MGTLMRANTPVSRMMTTYTRRGPGQSYLKNVLSICIKKIVEAGDENLEINPLKVLIFLSSFVFVHHLNSLLSSPGV